MIRGSAAHFRATSGNYVHNFRLVDERADRYHSNRAVQTTSCGENVVLSLCKAVWFEHVGRKISSYSLESLDTVLMRMFDCLRIKARRDVPQNPYSFDEIQKVLGQLSFEYWWHESKILSGMNQEAIRSIRTQQCPYLKYPEMPSTPPHTYILQPCPTPPRQLGKLPSCCSWLPQQPGPCRCGRT